MHTLTHRRMKRFSWALVATVLAPAVLAAGAPAIPPEGGELPSEPMPAPTQPAPPSVPPEIDTVVRVNEKDADVDVVHVKGNQLVKLDLMHGDYVTISASGTIWSGVWFAGRNGPKGWDSTDRDLKFPLPGSHPYGLLKRIGDGEDDGYSYVGAGQEFRYWGPSYRTLKLRINDDRPGNGNGGFNVDVRVFR